MVTEKKILTKKKKKGESNWTLKWETSTNRRQPQDSQKTKKEKQNLRKTKVTDKHPYKKKGICITRITL